ncbi:MAG: hypothetical protein LC796_16320 [Acidobacteria bacterium]|nr:hypothetical protein [Acidobacteriota bacterium]MCA1611839.1 hypothetical protein [Acidobacteriota bacterium]
MRGAAPLAAAALACTLSGCASSSPAPASRATPSGPRAPYDAPAAAAHQVDITIRSRAAKEILASLSRPKFEASDTKLLEDLPAVRFAIQDSRRGVEVFERDFAAAFDEKTRTSVFDFRSIRGSKERWQALLDAVEPREADLSRMASTRAAALLPGDRPVTARLDVFLSFGVAGLGDHIVLKGENGREAMVLDLARALGDSEGEPLESRMSRIARLIAGEAFRQAWAVYRAQNPAWQHPDPQLGQLDVLLRAVAEAGPVAVYTVDENFFPLSTWLKEPMKRAIEDLNRRAERLAEAEGNLERRMELTGEIRRGDFARRIAGQDGAYLVDGVIQHSGLAGLRQALQAGPRALFDAYDKAAQADKTLVPLSKVIRDRLAGVPAKPAPPR